MIGALITGTVAMESDSKALENQSSNIANLNTNGYKRIESHFRTLLGLSVTKEDHQTSGMTMYERVRIDEEGNISSTGRNLDMAINGKGLFIIRDTVQGGLKGRIYYGRDGSFRLADINGESFLIDKNGKYLQGWKYTNGGYSGAITSVHYDKEKPWKFEKTTEAKIKGVIPSTAKIGDSFDFSVKVINSQGKDDGINIKCVKKATNQWDIEYKDPSGKPVSTSVQFNGVGKLVSVPSIITGDGVSLKLDMEQKGSRRIELDHDSNGHPTVFLNNTYFNKKGELIGSYSDGLTRPIYKIPLMSFRNIGSLHSESGNIFTDGEKTGKGTIMDLASNKWTTTISPGALEGSNVNLSKEFVDMIQIQRAYSAASKTVTTADEMIMTARDLIR